MWLRQLRRCAERMGGATRRKPRSAKREDLKSVTALAVINPPSCKAILSTAPAATPRPHISPVPVSGLWGA